MCFTLYPNTIYQTLFYCKSFMYWSFQNGDQIDYRIHVIIIVEARMFELCNGIGGGSALGSRVLVNLLFT